MIMGPIAPAVKRFYQACLASAEGVGIWAGIALPILLHGLLLATRRRSRPPPPLPPPPGVSPAPPPQAKPAVSVADRGGRGGAARGGARSSPRAPAGWGWPTVFSAPAAFFLWAATATGP